MAPFEIEETAPRKDTVGKFIVRHAQGRFQRPQFGIKFVGENLAGQLDGRSADRTGKGRAHQPLDLFIGEADHALNIVW